MLTIVEDRVQYPEISQAALDHHAGKTFAWMTEPLPIGDDGAPKAPKPTKKQIEEGYCRVRQFLFQKETDPLFFKVQRGETSQEEYQAAVDDIKRRWSPPSKHTE